MSWIKSSIVMKSFSLATACPNDDDEAPPPWSAFTVNDDVPLDAPLAPLLHRGTSNHVSPDETPLDQVRFDITAI